MITTEQHAQILEAYLSRLTISDLNKLAMQKVVETHLSLNGSDSAQRSVGENSKELLQSIIGHLHPNDMKNIEMIVTRTFEESIIRKGRSKNQTSDSDMSPG